MSYGISSQNKDILFKILSENYKNKSFRVYGLDDLPPIKEVLPTNLPAIQLNEKRSDNIFLLEDNTILILEYESTLDNKAILKYGHYAFRIAETYYESKLHRVIIAVIYTGEIEKAPNSLDLDCIKLYVRQVFLSKFSESEIYNYLKTKIENKEQLTDEDIMSFIILPLIPKNTKQDFIEKAVILAQEIVDENIQGFIIAGILSATDKFIDKDYSEKLKGWLYMTKIGRLFEEEKIEYAQKYAQEYAQKREKETKQEIARKMLSENIDILTIMKVTMLSKSEILSLQNELASNA